MAGTGDVQADKSDAGGRLTRVLAAMEKLFSEQLFPRRGLGGHHKIQA